MALEDRIIELSDANQDRTNEFPDSKIINVPMKLQPKNDIQYKAVEFLNNIASSKHQAFLSLDVGIGKTYCTVKHIVEI